MRIIEWIIEHAQYILFVLAIIVSGITVILARIAERKAKMIKNTIKDLGDDKNANMDLLDELEKAEKDLQNANNILTIVSKIVPSAVIMAENSGMQVTGEAKKLLAVSKVIQQCAVNGIDYSTYSAEVDQAIESQVALSKQVNYIANS